MIQESKMTVEELNIRISADAENFKKELEAAKASVAAFRDEAVAAGKQVTAAFYGLIGTQVSAAETVSQAAVTTAADIDTRSSDKYSTVTLPHAIPSYVPEENIYYTNNGVSYQGTANVPDLARNETVIGAVGGQASEPQPFNITTTVELDGDKIGESVNRFNLLRGKITNGIYQ